MLRAIYDYIHPTMFITGSCEDLATRLAQKAPGIDRSYFLSGGSEANEAAIKLACQIQVERGNPTR